MATRWNCTKPEDAWGLVSHFLGNHLLVISMYAEQVTGESEEDKEKRERVVSDTRAELVGSLYVIVRNMRQHNHSDDADRIQLILDMVTDQAVTQQRVRSAIHDKHRELDAGKREFEAQLARLRAEHGPKD